MDKVELDHKAALREERRRQREYDSLSQAVERLRQVPANWKKLTDPLGEIAKCERIREV